MRECLDVYQSINITLCTQEMNSDEVELEDEELEIKNLD